VLANGDRLARMLNQQRALQRRINGYDANDQTVEQRIANFKISMFALMAELYEAVDEMGWKEWATSRHFNASRVQNEIVDAWHFFMNLVTLSGMSADDLYDGYMRKLAVNHKRRDDGYDGVTGKCPQCHRDLGEVDLKEVHVQTPFPRVDLHCPCGHAVGSLPV